MEQVDGQMRRRRRRIRRGTVVALAAVIGVVIVALAAGGLVALRGSGSSSPHSPSEPLVDSLVTGGPQASATAGGLTYTARLSPGPYFLSEFTVAQLTLSNGGRQSYQISGAVTSANFNEALYVALTGGSGPTYTLPLAAAPWSFPAPGINTLAPGQTWTETFYLPLTRSGKVTLSAKALFTTSKQDGHGGEVISYDDGPFAGHLPSLHLTISPTIPADRTLALTTGSASGTPTVTVAGPAAALGRVYSLEDETCGPAGGGAGSTSEMPSGWKWLDGARIKEPGCPGPNEVWAYALAAPGYAIATGGAIP